MSCKLVPNDNGCSKRLQLNLGSPQSQIVNPKSTQFYKKSLKGSRSFNSTTIKKLEAKTYLNRGIFAKFPVVLFVYTSPVAIMVSKQQASKLALELKKLIQSSHRKNQMVNIDALCQTISQHLGWIALNEHQDYY